MTPDVEQIRVALAAATPKRWPGERRGPDYIDWLKANGSILANAPVWLASCISEIERLRAVVESQAEHIAEGDQMAEEDKAEIERLRAEQNTDRESKGDAPDRITLLVAERNAALGEVELVRLTAFTLEGQRDAALAECEQLRHECLLRDTTTGELKECEAELVAALAECERLRNTVEELHIAWGNEIELRSTWRACADQLATFPDTPGHARKALVVYESLSRGVQAPEAGETTL